MPDANPISGPYTVTREPVLYTNEASSFVVVNSANSPFFFTGSYSNTLGFIVSEPAGVEISGSAGYNITGSAVATGQFQPIPVYKIATSGTGRVLVLFGK
jgi:hypothetical protein